MTKPRIVFGYRYGVLGGVATQLLNRLPAFDRQFDVRVLFEKDDGMVQRFPGDTAVVLGSSEERVEWLKDLNPDLFVVIDSPALISDWKAALRPGFLVLEVHTTTANLGYLSHLTRDDGVSGIITVSQYMSEVVSETEIGRTVPVAVVENCLPDDHFDLPSLTEESPGGPVPIIWIGKLDGHKRFLTALEIMNDIHGQIAPDLDAVSLMIGGYTAPETKVRHLLRTVMNRPNLRGRFEWWPSVETNLMPGLLRNVALRGGIQLSTTTNESFGMALVESLVAGGRVVAPSAGALVDLIPASMRYPANEFDAATKLAIELLTDRDKAVADVQNAASDFADRLRPRHSLNAFLHALDSFAILL